MNGERTIENNKEEVPFQHYCELFRELNPEEAAARCAVPYENGFFTVRMLDTDYRIGWPEFSISTASGTGIALTKLPMQTFLMRFLLSGRHTEPAVPSKTFRELPWGEVYIGPFTGRCITRAAFSFGTKLARFRTGAEALGGIPAGHGDASYRFQLIDNYSMELIVWEGDDEFPPNSQILYTDSFAEGFSAEDRVVCGDILISAIKEKM